AMRFCGPIILLCVAQSSIWAADKLTPQLILAAKAGDDVKLEGLTADRVNLNGVTKDGMTPLLAAITSNHPSTVKLLLGKGAKVDARDNRRATPLFVAAREGYDDALLALLAAGADVDASDMDGWTPLLRAARGNHATTAQLLIDHGANV